MKNLSPNKTRVTLSEEGIKIHTEIIKTLTVCSHLKENDLMSKYILKRIFKDLCNPYNIVTCDFKFTEEPNMN